MCPYHPKYEWSVWVSKGLYIFIYPYTSGKQNPSSQNISFSNFVDEVNAACSLIPLCSVALIDGNWAHKITSSMLSFSLQLYTVVQHVKHFNDVVEFGENQEFTDDFEYLATGLKTGQPLNTRCLRCGRHSFSVYSDHSVMFKLWHNVCSLQSFCNCVQCY